MNVSKHITDPTYLKVTCFSYKKQIYCKLSPVVKASCFFFNKEIEFLHKSKYFSLKILYKILKISSDKEDPLLPLTISHARLWCVDSKTKGEMHVIFCFVFHWYTCTSFEFLSILCSIIVLHVFFFLILPSFWCRIP